ncbi:hypothetical protein SDJN03_29197, partial [Cucurbita argyrosperma subsp. sororia]
MGDLMNYLKRLASGGNNSSEKQSQCLTVSERLQCCFVAFKVKRKNLDAMNVDLQDFSVQLIQYCTRVQACKRPWWISRWQKNVKCRNLLENDSWVGSVSGSIAPYASDPTLSGALASVLWELNLLWKHYHPAVSTMSTSISSMNSAQNQVYISTVPPQQAFKDLSLE